MSTKSIQPQDKYVLRLPDGLRDQVKMAADLNKRSMNAEIIARIERTFEQEFISGRNRHDVLLAFIEEAKRRELNIKEFSDGELQTELALRAEGKD